MMRGRIWVESEEGQGSRFHFTAHFGVATEVLGAQPNEEASLSAGPVLVVDDNATNRHILSDLLTRWGMQCTVKGDGEAGLAALRQAKAKGCRFQLLISDAHMPAMDGFTWHSKLRTIPNWATRRL